MVPGGVVRGLDLRSRAKICARELASVASRGLPVASRGPLVASRGPSVDDGTDDIYNSKVSNFKHDIGTNILVSQCIDHKATFPDTHRHFRPAIEICRNVLIVRGGLELKRSKFQQLKLGFAANAISDFSILSYTEIH